jgi:rhodanese-related sulfurtransferase
MSIYIEKYLDEKKIDYLLNDSVEEFLSDKKAITKNNKTIEFDMVIFATGITPNVELAKKIGVNLGKYNGILVNDYMETNLKDIYAVGDCCEHKFRLTGDYIYRPLGSTANKMGRIAGENITGIKREFKGILGTGIFKVFDLAVGQTGLTEREARKLGYDIEIIHNIKEDKSKYLKESKEIVIKAIADRKTQKLLGVQIVGEAGVDKRVDVFATLITYNVPVGDFFNLDLAYAPPFATTKDPVLYTGMILDNALNRGRKILTPNVLIENRDKYKVIDVRSKKDYDKGHIEEAYHIPLAELESRLDEFDKEENIAVHCNKGVTGNAAQNLLINHGFKNVYNISGGYKNYKIQKDYLYK